MKYRPLGKTGVNVSEVGLGTWQLGGSDWGNMTDDDALKVMHRSVDLGVNFFDTADVYGGGRSEQLIGRFLKEVKGKLHVATKLGRRGDPGWPTNFTLDTVRKHTQDSLKRLGIDSIFLQQWHCIPTEEFQRGDVFEHLRQMKKEGLIQHWGCSVESVEEGLICMEHEDCASLQVIYNIFRQKLTDSLLTVAKEKEVGILARVPLASGLLSGKFKPGHKFSESDHRNYNADGQKFNVGETFAGVPLEKGIGFAQQIQAILKPSEQATMAQKSLRWILDNDAVSTVIPGATKLAQAESNAKASDLPPLDAATHLALMQLYSREIAPTIRGKY
jgi:aryl-alcohol dehydrogenase-like predicted oxidoreductase